MLTELTIILPAFIAGVAILAIHVPLGIEMLRREIIFLDLAIAQLAAMGAFFITLMFHEKEGTLAFLLMSQGAALFFAFLGALFFMYAGKRYKAYLVEGFVGCVFVLSATLVLLIMSHSAATGEHLTDLLAGQLLFISWPQVWILAVMAAITAVLMYRFPKAILGKYYYFVLALFVMMTVQVAGIYFSFTTLIFPAVGVFFVKKYKNKLLLSYAGCLLGLIGALLAALWFDLSAGPAIVWGIAVCMFVIFCMKSYFIRKNV
ncbi:MAG: metal ABC transporter permease [Elusimicrobia bacterium]|nr:metal ABC transporter permease [Elusimicrobiota bacterium]